MARNNRDKKIRMRGADIQELQAQLRQLGFTINDKEGTFGKTTRQAVEDFQT